MCQFATIILLLPMWATTGSATESRGLPFDQAVDRVVERERNFVAAMKGLHPLAETYVQDFRQSPDHAVEPVNDHYFLGRISLNDALRETLFKRQRAGSHSSDPFSSIFSEKLVPQGFAQMIVLDPDFQKSNYRFSFVRREFLGEVRCIVIDVQPRDSERKGLFSGRIWVEDRDFNIVRFNGTYSGNSKYKHYLHFDSWRFNLQADVWLPSCTYVEESGTQPGSPLSHDLLLKAQIRLWAYDAEQISHHDEFTQITVDSVDDRSGTEDYGPLKAQRMWERMAEDNAIDHLQKIGLVAPVGEVDKVLQTVVNNIIIGNRLEIEPQVRCRVLLTAPLESFTVGHTIVVSRGLLDALPDEASLAAILAHELGHIALGHRVDTSFAFNDRFFFPDSETFRRLDFERNTADEEAADKKAIELLTSSTYKDQLPSAGLFLRALHNRSLVFANLIRPHLGNRMETDSYTRMAAILNSAPALEKWRLDQIAALPIGSRIKLDPWSNEIAIMNANSVAPLSASEKMPFEVSPFFPFLRYSQADRKLVAENPAKN